ncbi:hypothetical protein JZ751_024177 [Albula glossodonta]|uniref:Uncharacterized protein n=1 Tax=Albula glossodonta TaxID=121402 RepID=A0A8T2NFL0_9TELE|nr:hypothetical protein JZ751_024177 [Albula glossodonta]
MNASSGFDSLARPLSTRPKPAAAAGLLEKKGASCQNSQTAYFAECCFLFLPPYTNIQRTHHTRIPSASLFIWQIGAALEEICRGSVPHVGFSRNIKPASQLAIAWRSLSFGTVGKQIFALYLPLLARLDSELRICKAQALFN